jgi:hypothetical protein
MNMSKILDFEEMKDVLLKECRVVAKTGATVAYYWPGIPRSLQREGLEELERLLEDESVVTKKIKVLRLVRGHEQ